MGGRETTGGGLGIQEFNECRDGPCRVYPQPPGINVTLIYYLLI
jgi:hypothetical protein